MFTISEASKLDREYYWYNKLKSRCRHFQKQIDILDKMNDRNEPAQIELVRMKKLCELIEQRGIYNKTLIEQTRRIVKWNETIEDHWKRVTEGEEYLKYKYNESDFERSYLKKLKTQNKCARQISFKWRFTMELKERIYEKCYIIMNTLTVNPESYGAVFSYGSKIFGQYIKDVEKLTESISWFAVTEKGELGREHIHVIHCLKGIPRSWRGDPNIGEIVPKKREVIPMKRLWQAGFSNPIAVRINGDDSWSRIGWRWPVKLNGTKVVGPYPTGNAGKIANYISKYVSKTIHQKGGTKWKTRMSKNLGTETLNRILQKMNQEDLIILTDPPSHMSFKIHKKNIPKSILRKNSIKLLLKKMKKSEELSKNLLGLIHRPSILKRIANSIMPKQDHSFPSIIITGTKNTRKTDLYRIQKIIDQETEHLLEDEYSIPGTTIKQ